MEILEGEMAIDHIHLLLMIPPKMSVSGFMGYLKGKSSLIIYQKHGTAKFKYRNREFWCRGYFVDTVTYFYIYLIATNYILGFDSQLKNETKNFVQADAAEAAKQGALQQLVDEKFGEII